MGKVKAIVLGAAAAYLVAQVIDAVMYTPNATDAQIAAQTQPAAAVGIAAGALLAWTLWP